MKSWFLTHWVSDNEDGLLPWRDPKLHRGQMDSPFHNKGWSTAHLNCDPCSQLATLLYDTLTIEELSNG